jgi:O-antigen/teichoic acid export membrane protein
MSVPLARADAANGRITERFMSVPPVAEPPLDHRRQLARGMFWMGSATLVAKLIDTAAIVIVLGFLSQEQLGTATLASSVIAFLESLNALGIGVALIQRQGLTPAEKASAHWYSILVGVVLTALAFLGAPLFAAVYSAPELTLMTQVGSIKLLLVGMATVPIAMLSRDLRFRDVGLISTIATLLASGLTIVLAAAGAGAWAPVLANVAHGLFQLLGVCVLAPFFPRPALSLSLLRPMIRAGKHLAGGSLLSQITRNLDYFIIGHFGVGALGTYRIAFDLAMAPMQVILNVIGRSALPVYSRLATQLPELLNAFGWTVRSLWMLGLAPILVVFLQGERLFELLAKTPEPHTLLVVRCLCVAALLRAASYPFPQVLAAIGHTRRSLLEALSSTLLIALSMTALVAFGSGPVAVRVAIAWLVAYVLQLGVDLLLTHRLLPGIGQALLRALPLPLGIALLVGAVTLLVVPVLRLDATPWPALAHGVLVVGLYWLGLRTLAGVRLRSLLKAGSSK